jgi:lantibiotic modifying enzyme
MNQHYLEAAREVGHFLESQRIAGSNGALWHRNAGQPGRPVHTLYHGSAGIVLFYLELHRATGEAEWLSVAAEAGVQLRHYIQEKLDAGKHLTIGLFSGWPGYVFVLDQLSLATGDQSFRTLARSAYLQILEQASAIGAGMGWIEPMPFSDITGHSGDREIYDLSVGAAGVGLLSLYAHEHQLHPDALDHARRICDRLLEVGETTTDGTRWKVMSDMPWTFNAPNFAHGAAGVGYLLARTAQSTGDPRYLQAAIEAANYVVSRSYPSGDGHLVCHNEDRQPPDLFYLGVCHGPAGTGRLMYLLYTLTGDEKWDRWLRGNVTGLLATGAPERRTPGLWLNYGQCCGDAGIGDYACYLLRATGDTSYRELAQRIAEQLIRNTTPSQIGHAWQQAEHRSRPDFVETQTGYMQGAAGIGSFLLHLATVDEEIAAKIKLPDIPFPEQRKAAVA